MRSLIVGAALFAALSAVLFVGFGCHCDLPDFDPFDRHGDHGRDHGDHGDRGNHGGDHGEHGGGDRGHRRLESEPPAAKPAPTTEVDAPGFHLEIAPRPQ